MYFVELSAAQRSKAMEKKQHFDFKMKVLAIDAVVQRDISDKAFRVYCYLLCRYNSGSKQCNPSIDNMSKKLGKSHCTIKRAIRELKDKKVISYWRGSPTTGSNMYRLEGSSEGIYEQRVSNLSKVGVSFASNEVSELSPKYNNEYNKEYNIQRVSFEPELPKGSGSKEISHKEWLKAGEIISQTIRGKVIK